MILFEKYDQVEKDGKYYYVLTSPFYDKKVDMLADLSRSMAPLVEQTLLQQKIIREYRANNFRYRHNIDQLKAVKEYLTVELNAMEDPFITSSSSQDFQKMLELLLFSVGCQIKSMEEHGRTEYGIG